MITCTFYLEFYPPNGATFGIPRSFSDGFWEQIDAAKIPFYPWYALVSQALAIEIPSIL